ncbi:uncharacterized protein [Ptychodera flava]|uniref:uncharacterized protein isoform X2 n=1 Tax=Ptychodera flava TaxID=63121 RepID=UPI003969BC45
MSIDYSSAAITVAGVSITYGITYPWLLKAINNYIERLWTGRFLANLVLLQSKQNEDKLLLDCVEYENVEARIVYWTEYGYHRSDDDTVPFTSDIDVIQGQRINFNIDKAFEIFTTCEYNIMFCFPKRRNHCELTIKRHPSVPETDLQGGSIIFTYNKAEKKILNFVLSWNKGSTSNLKKDQKTQATMTVAPGEDIGGPEDTDNRKGSTMV